MGSAVTKIPESVADLDIAWVAETLVKHGANVLAAAAELNVPAPDLRRLTLVKQELIDAALEAEEERLDLAEAVVDAALRSDSNRRKEAAAYFVLKNSVRSKKRGWIPSSSAGVEEGANANSANAKHVVFHWADSDGSVRSLSTETIRRDGKDIEVPSYRPQAPDQIEGELAPAATALEYQGAVPDPTAEPVVVAEPADVASSAPAITELAEPPPDPKLVAVERLERERVAAWIRRRVTPSPREICFRCRRTFIAGDRWTEAVGDDGGSRARFHDKCHQEWLAELEVEARKFLGLED